MTVRRAQKKDADRINELLFQVAELHSSLRPDIFRTNAKKYTDNELFAIIENDATPVFVATDLDGTVLGYAFCIYEQVVNNSLLCDMKSLYIDDLCVDKAHRGKHIGKALYLHVLEEAKRNGCYRITLNVWKLNEGAMKFYEKCGLSPLKTVMEKLL